MGKLTYAAALVLMTTSISLAILKGSGDGKVGFSQKLKEQAEQINKNEDEVKSPDVSKEQGLKEQEKDQKQP